MGSGGEEDVKKVGKTDGQLAAGGLHGNET